MRFLSRFRGLSSRIYAAFLVAAVVPVMIAGLVGIFYSLKALKAETLQHLAQEVASRSSAITGFADQLSSELLYLSISPTLRELANGLASGQGVSDGARRRLEQDYAAFAKVYPYIYQIRFLGADGTELVRLDRAGERIRIVPHAELQDKSDRYYVTETLQLGSGQIYVSPLDLNIEHGKPEVPEKPVIRFATPVADSAGATRGLLIVNLHAEFLLGQIQEIASARDGVTYLLDRSGNYLARSARPADSGQPFRMLSAHTLERHYGSALLHRALGGARGTEVVGDWIVAFAPVLIGAANAEVRAAPMEWSIMLAFPQRRLFAAVFNLYLLYAVLAVSLALTAAAGFLLSRRLLRPLTQLQQETEEIARGNFSRRVEIVGGDEIADLGTRFNAMAAQLERSYRFLEERKGTLEQEVRARTADLDNERQNLATIIEHISDGVLALSPDGTIERANKSAASLLAAERASLAGRHIRQFWPGWDGWLQQPPPQAAAPRHADLHVLGRTLSVSVAAIAAADGLKGYIVVARDVSEERRLQEERRELDRQIFQTEKMTALGELAMGLAHEIGNPLAGMKAVAQMLMEEDGLSQKHREYLQRIHGEVNRLSEFLRTFHGFSAPQETHPVPCRLEPALEDVLLWTRKEARSRGVAISYAPCGEQVPALWADPNQLKQVLLNLVINAVQAMPEGGEIRIGMCFGIAHPEDLQGELLRMRICVRDTGPGIPADVLPRIFDPFFTTRADGSGLGLAVVKKIALQHGADIHVRSTPGRGTSFELVWPIVPPPDPREIERLRRAAATQCPLETHHA